MGRRAKGPRALGPYPHRDGWIVRIRGLGDRAGASDGTPRSRTFTSERAAIVYRDDYNAEHDPERTVETALEEYERHLIRKGNKPGSIATTKHRVSQFLEPALAEPLDSLSGRRCAALYDALISRAVVVGRGRKDGETTERARAVDTHRNTLAEAKSFLRWCAAPPRRWLAANPLEGVEGIGARVHGKDQLRIDEARQWERVALRLARTGEDWEREGATTALVTLLLGTRASEVTLRVVRDLDDDGRLLWIPDAKTDAGIRQLEVPPILRPLLAAAAKDKAPDERLLGEHDRNYPRKWVQRICELAGVPRVCAQAMRGLHGTLAVKRGATGRLVADALGHESETTTRRSYVKREATDAARQRTALAVLQGGRGRR